MAKKVNQPVMRPRFSFMWFWAMVAMVIIGYSMLGEAVQSNLHQHPTNSTERNIVR